MKTGVPVGGVEASGDRGPEPQLLCLTQPERRVDDGANTARERNLPEVDGVRRKWRIGQR